MEIGINYLAVLVSAVAVYVLGMLWYMPLFGKQWLKEMQWSPKKIKEMQKNGSKLNYLFGFLTYLVTAFVFAHILNMIGLVGAMQGMQTGAWIWLGFVATIQLGSVMWEGKSMRLFFINAGYHLVSFLIMGAILGGWH